MRRSVNWRRQGHDYIWAPGQLVMAAAEIPCGVFLLEGCAKTGDDIDSALSINLDPA